MNDLIITKKSTQCPAFVLHLMLLSHRSLNEIFTAFQYLCDCHDIVAQEPSEQRL